MRKWIGMMALVCGVLASVVAAHGAALVSPDEVDSVLPDPQQYKLDHSIDVAYSGMRAFMTQFSAYFTYTINQTTPGYRQTLYSNFLHGSYVASKKFFNFDPGPPIESGRSLDLLIAGIGFFVVETPVTNAFTRDGRLNIRSDGYLVTYGGHRILGNRGPIRVKSPKVYISPAGAVFDDGEWIDYLRIMTPINMAKTDTYNSVLFFTEPENLRAVEPQEFRLQPGYYEGANVPKSLGIGDTGRYVMPYYGSTDVIRRVVKSMRAGIRVGN
jgi:flagellar basal body rod protein FlgG